MLKFFFKIAALVLFVSMASSSFAGMMPFTDALNRFTISFPAEWETKPNHLSVPVISFSPISGPADTMRENVNVVTEQLPPSILVEQYYNANIANMSRSLGNFQVNEKTNVMIGGQPAIRIIASYQMQQISVKALTHFMVSPMANKGYVITSTATPESFLQFQPVFDAIAQSFRIQ